MHGGIGLLVGVSAAVANVMCIGAGVAFDWAPAKAFLLSIGLEIGGSLV